MTEVRYPKRLIEVDLPIKRISAHARREKSIRHGHISTLHIWWARRPLAACRAVICAALWPDPADPLCPPAFRDAAFTVLNELRANVNEGTVSKDTRDAGPAISRMHFASSAEEGADLRRSLLDFIAEFANWDLSTNQPFLQASRALTQAAHEALGGLPGTRPLVVDPFAGGGSIPLEALRVGADAFASDLNPIPVLLNKVVLEYIPRYGQRLADEVRKWGAWIKEEAEKELAEFYPRDPDGATPIAYLWARTIRCEGPGCGADVPLMRSLWLAKKANRSVALQLIPNQEERRVDFRIIVKTKEGWVDQADRKLRVATPNLDGTVLRGSATCPCCGFTTPVARVREQLTTRKGGGDDAKLFCVVTQNDDESSVSYSIPGGKHTGILQRVKTRLLSDIQGNKRLMSFVPTEPTPMGGGSGAGRAFSQRHYGMVNFDSLFNPRQQLALATFAKLIDDVGSNLSESKGREFALAVCSILSLALGKLADFQSSLCSWRITRTCVRSTFVRQALPITWDYGEMNPFAGSAGDWSEACRYLDLFIQAVNQSKLHSGASEQANALALPLPDELAAAMITDPPYYDAVPYSDLSDYFYVWHRRALQNFDLDLLKAPLTPKKEECIVDEVKGKDPRYFEQTMHQAMAEGRRALAPNGIATVVFAHKSTKGWEALLQALVDSGWIVTGSWPIDTERPGRLRANDSAALASSIHIVCRPRENPDGSLRTDDVGDWREVLTELPRRIHEWMPRLAAEGVVGADAIFACLGPALEIFSRYSRVEKASGEEVKLKEYLEQVWAAVAREALSTVLNDADANALDPDARLTVIWLWTLGAGAEETSSGGEESEETEDDEIPAGKTQGGFLLEYDAARKIAQGLGARLEELTHVVEVKGDKARLLPLSERARYLFGKTESLASQPKKRAKSPQMSLFAQIEEAESARGWDEIGPPKGVTTTLDRIHQSMLLFGTGRGEALKRFLVEEGVGRQAEFWTLAQSLSALYPAGSEEKRWVDGVLARKKGLGFG